MVNWLLRYRYSLSPSYHTLCTAIDTDHIIVGLDMSGNSSSQPLFGFIVTFWIGALATSFTNKGHIYCNDCDMSKEDQ